jgi:hypothetical protein
MTSSKKAAPAAESSTSAANSINETELTAGAERLADELRPFVPQNALPAHGVGRAEDLQLSICRKLREVSE